MRGDGSDDDNSAGVQPATSAGVRSICLSGKRWGDGRRRPVYTVQWGQFLNIIADQSGVFRHIKRTGCARSGCLVPPLKSSSVELPAVGYARLPLPSVDNSLMPELVWVPTLPQPTGRIVEGEVPVPRWRLAREGPFLVERSPESIRSLGPGCAFRNTTYRMSDYAEPVGDYGLPLNHPRFVEWIGVPQSAGLIELSGRQWVSQRDWGSCR